MKRKYLLFSFVALMVCLLLTGCGEEEKKKEEVKEVKNSNYVIDLDSNVSGYSWSYELSLYEEENETADKEEDKETKEDKDAKETKKDEEEKTTTKEEIKPEDLVEVTNEYIEKCEDDEKTTDCPGVDSFTVKGLKAGKVKLEFKYQFSSKKKTKTTKTATYILEVDKNLNVLEVSHDGSYFEKEAE